MHVTRKTNQELEVVDSLIWLSVLFLCVFAGFAYRVYLEPSRNSGFGLGLVLLFVIVPLRKETVVFDAALQQVRWKRLRMFKVATGSIPFSAITGIGIEALASGRGGATYRLAIQTADNKPVPMSDAYGNSRAHYESLQAEILEFLHLDAAKAAPAYDVGDEESIRSLLMEGRKVEAIKLMRSSQKIGLAEAVDQVDAIAQKMKAAK
ncbi:MAG: hypothetical protein WCA10_14610 [Terracidiphilus sp.]